MHGQRFPMRDEERRSQERAFVDWNHLELGGIPDVYPSASDGQDIVIALRTLLTRESRVSIPRPRRGLYQAKPGIVLVQTR